MANITLTFEGSETHFKVELMGMNQVTGGQEVLREIPLNNPETIEDTENANAIKITSLTGFNVDSVSSNYPMSPVDGSQNLDFELVSTGVYESSTSGIYNDGSYDVSVSVVRTEDALAFSFNAPSGSISVNLFNSLGELVKDFSDVENVEILESEYSSGDYLRVEGTEGFLISDFNPLLGDQNQVDGSYNWQFTETEPNIYDAVLNEFNDSLESYTIQVEVEGEVVTSSPFNRIYNIDNDTLISLGEEAPIDVLGNDINLTSYIINILQLPFKIPEDFIGIKRPLSLGEWESATLEADTIISEKVIIPLGDIEVDEIGNVLDYESTYEMMLPFIEGIQTIEPKYIIGKTITTEYVLDVYSGEITVNVYNGESDPFLSFGSNVGRTIPYRIASNEQTLISGVTGVENNLISPKIRVNIPELNEGDFSNLVLVNGNLTNVSGYVQFDELELELVANSNAKESIKTSLQNGVIIK